EHREGFQLEVRAHVVPRGDDAVDLVGGTRVLHGARLPDVSTSRISTGRGRRALPPTRLPPRRFSALRPVKAKKRRGGRRSAWARRGRSTTTPAYRRVGAVRFVVERARIFTPLSQGESGCSSKADIQFPLQGPSRVLSV